eukprot:scaffold42368_cov56-Phaeocystis_antarctica.AAC.2
MSWHRFMTGLDLTRTSSHTSPLRGRVGRAAVWSPYGTRPECGTRGISHPRNGRVPEGAPPTIRCAAGVPGGRWGSVVYGWRAPARPPRVVFVLGVASLKNSLTSGKKCPPKIAYSVNLYFR